MHAEHAHHHHGGSAIPESRQRLAHEPSVFRRFGAILLRTGQAFFADNISNLGASLAFYTTIAIAPLLVIAVAAAGIIFDQTEARQRVISEIASLAGTQAGEAVKAVHSPAQSASGTIATILGVATLIFGAMGVFQHLQDALNSIWRVHAPEGKGWWFVVRRRLFSIATVMTTGFLLLVSLVASAALSWLGGRTFQRFGLPVTALQILNNVISFSAVSLLFALLFKMLPDTKVRWREVWVGAVFTAFLFTLGKSALGLYLGRASVTSAYGAAGSLVVLLLWCYYAAQIVFLGAEFTRVTALSNGGRDFRPFEEPRQQSRPF